MTSLTLVLSDTVLTEVIVELEMGCFLGRPRFLATGCTSEMFVSGRDFAKIGYW